MKAFFRNWNAALAWSFQSNSMSFLSKAVMGDATGEHFSMNRL